jgi:hypothetical protein
MTNDEFERIATAVIHMSGFNLAGQGGVHVPLRGVIRILYTNLHPDDKAAWKLLEDGGIERVGVHES